MKLKNAIDILKGFNDGYTFQECTTCFKFNEKNGCCDKQKCEALKAIDTILKYVERKYKSRKKKRETNSIRKIYESLEKQDETILFQVKRRSTLNKMLEEFDDFYKWIYWDKYKEIPLKEIYLCVGSWRLGMAGIFPASMHDNDGHYCFDNFVIDWKASPSMQWDQERNVDKFIEIMDKYRSDIKVSRKKYDEFR